MLPALCSALMDRTTTGWLRVRIMCLSGVSCLSAAWIFECASTKLNTGWNTRLVQAVPTTYHTHILDKVLRLCVLPTKDEGPPMYFSNHKLKNVFWGKSCVIVVGNFYTTQTQSKQRSIYQARLISMHNIIEYHNLNVHVRDCIIKWRPFFLLGNVDILPVIHGLLRHRIKFRY